VGRPLKSRAYQSSALLANFWIALSYRVGSSKGSSCAKNGFSQSCVARTYRSSGSKCIWKWSFGS